MDAVSKASISPQRQPPSRYRINRRAAYILSAAFLAIGGVSAGVCLAYLNPQRRLEYLRQSADTYLERHEWKQAAIQLANVVGLAPEDKNAWLQLAGAQLQLLQNDELKLAAKTALLHQVVACYRKVVELDPLCLEAQRWLLELDLRAGDWKQARLRLTAFANEIETDPLVAAGREMVPTAHSEVVAKARYLLAAEGDHEAEVAELLEPHWKTEPADLEVLGPLAYAWTKLGRYRDRDEAIRRADSMLAGAPQLDLIRAECAGADGDLDGAIRLADAALSCDRLRPAVYRLLADLYRRKAGSEPQKASEYLRRAVAEYRKAIALAPDDYCSINNAAWLLGSSLGQVDEALILTNTAFTNSAKPPAELLDTHGWLLHLSGKPDAALEFLQRAAAADPHNSIVQWHILLATASLRGWLAPKSTGAIVSNRLRESWENIKRSVSPPARLTARESRTSSEEVR